MTEQKKSKNPFINAAMAAKTAAASGVPIGKANQIQNVKFKNQVAVKKPASRSAGRGR